MKLNHPRRSKHERVLNDVLQFADIARTGVRHEGHQHFLRNIHHALTVQCIELGHEVQDEDGNVTSPLAQWRRFEGTTLIRSATQLKQTTRQFSSTAKTPSRIESKTAFRMCSRGMSLSVPPWS